MRKLSSKLALGVLAAICSLSASAMANTIQPILKSVTGVGPNYTYVYDLQITPNNGLTSTGGFPSSLVIVDFGIVSSATLSAVAGNNTAVADWNIVFAVGQGASNLPLWTGTPGLPGPPGSGEVDVVGSALYLHGINTLAAALDSAALSNISLKYVGVSGLSALGAGAEVQRSLIQLTIVSNLIPGSALPQALSINTTDTGSIGHADTFQMLTAAVPVPAAAWAGLSTLGGLGLVGAFRKRRTA